MTAYFINQKALDQLGDLVDEEDENFYSDFHDMLVDDMTKYATIVRDFDLKLAKAKEANDANYYREEYSRLDSARRRQHDAVIANLAVANRINKSEGLEPILDVGDGKSVHDVHRTDISDAVVSWLAETNYKDAQVQNKMEKNVDVADDYNYALKLNTFPLVQDKSRRYEFRSLWTGEIAEPSQVEKYIKSQLSDYSEKDQDKIKKAFNAALELRCVEKDKQVEGLEI